MSTLITTARLNDIDPQAWLADVLARIANLPVSRLHELLPWEWKDCARSENHMIRSQSPPELASSADSDEVARV